MSINANIYKDDPDKLTFKHDTANVTIESNGTNIIISKLPTSDPQVAGALWANNNVLTLSAGA